MFVSKRFQKWNTWSQSMEQDWLINIWRRFSWLNAPIKEGNIIWDIFYIFVHQFKMACNSDLVDGANKTRFFCSLFKKNYNVLSHLLFPQLLAKKMMSKCINSPFQEGEILEKCNLMRETVSWYDILKSLYFEVSLLYYAFTLYKWVFFS